MALVVRTLFMNSFSTLGLDLMLVHEGNQQLAHALANRVRVLAKRFGRLLLDRLRNGLSEHPLRR
jgi:hypothetical protein